MRNEVKVGLLSLATILILVFGYKYLKGSNIMDRTNTYYIRFRDVGQMDASAPVLIRGLSIGSVTKIQLDPDSADWVLVTIAVKREIRLPQNARAILVSQGLMGGKALILDYPAVCLENCLPNRSFIPGEIAGMLSSMVSKEEVQEYAKSVGSQLNKILDTAATNENVQLAATVKNVHLILANLAASTARINQLLEHSAGGLDQTVQNLETVTNALSRNAQGLSNSIKSLEDISTGIAAAKPGKMIQSADKALEESQQALRQLSQTLADSKQTIVQLNEVMSDIRAGKGSLGKLINDPALYQSLNRSSRNLELLLQDLRLNPKRYVHISVFGKDGTPYEVPSADPADR